MLAIVVQRLGHLVLTLLLIYTVTFFLIKITPGNPFQTGPKPLTAEVMRNLEAKYGLDRPWYEQYTSYLWDALHGDFGPSYTHRSRTVSEIIRDGFPVSFQLGLIAMAMAVVIGISLGTIAAIKQNTWVDYVSMFFAVFGISIPSFAMAAFLILILSVWLGVVPTGGWDGVFSTRIFIPTLALALAPGAMIARYTRASVLEVIRQDYISTARAKGLSERVINVRHVLRNSMIPVVTIGGIQLAFLITGSFFVEVICNIPGLGRTGIQAIMARDYPTIMAIVLLFAVVIAVVNTLVDLLYAYLDPRIRG